MSWYLFSKRLLKTKKSVEKCLLGEKKKKSDIDEFSNPLYYYCFSDPF